MASLWPGFSVTQVATHVPHSQPPPIMRNLLALVGLTLGLSALPCSAVSKAVLVGPAGSELFGRSSITALPNGYMVVQDPGYDLISPAVVDVGAVYLYAPGGRLVSTLRGSVANDRVGLGKVMVLESGHFVVSSTDWNGTRGAVTWGHASLGFANGPGVTVVSSTNSHVGSTMGDRVGDEVAPLANGHYVTATLFWDNGASVDAGAATWGNGFTGSTGVVSAANSIVGGTASNSVASSGIETLPNGNYLVRSPDWDSGATNVGAITFCQGDRAFPVGAVSSANSLVGSTASDRVGDRVEMLANGNW
jgi:hypothetical protein